MKDIVCRVSFLIGIFLLAAESFVIVCAGLVLMVIGGIAGGATKRKSPNVGRR